MEESIICGVDAHEKSLVNMISRGKEKPELKTVPNTEKGRRQLFGYLLALARKHKAGRIEMAYEASSMGFGLYDEAILYGIRCHVLAPTRIPRSYKDCKFKTDAYDSHKIFELIRGYVFAGNHLPEIWIPDEQLRQDRMLLRERHASVRRRSALKNKIQIILKSNGIKRPEYMACTWTQQYRRWLETLQLNGTAQHVFESLLRQISCVDNEIQILDKYIQELAGEERYKATNCLMAQFKGVGLITAMTFLTELGDMHRFRNRKELGSYIGLVPCSFESGNDTNKKGHITRQGSGRLRAVLCQAAWVWVRNDTHEDKTFKKILLKNPGKKKKAIVASMRRLAIRMWHCVKNSTTTQIEKKAA